MEMSEAESGITFEKARSDFYDGEWGPENDEQEWEPDMAKIRGLILQWARDVDSIDGYAPEPECHCFKTSVKAWLTDRLGDGAHAIVRTHDYSKAGFERVSKKQIAEQSKRLYDNNDEFRELVDEKWHEITKEDIDGDDEVAVGKYIAEYNGIDVSDDVLLTPSGLESDGDVATPEPRPRRYKYFIKRYVMESTSIESSYDRPNADALADNWVNWLRDELGTTKRYLVCSEGTEPAPGLHDVRVPDIAEWCRELWEDDEEFREHLKLKWNKSSGEEDKAGIEPDLNPIDRPDMDTGTDKQGQTGIGEW
jgi:hypothetical protein